MLAGGEERLNVCSGIILWDASAKVNAERALRSFG